jgi:hypothetical protein
MSLNFTWPDPFENEEESRSDLGRELNHSGKTIVNRKIIFIFNITEIRKMESQPAILAVPHRVFE